jgi:hypothetical protein
MEKSKWKNPNPKSQIPNKFQTPNAQLRQRVEAPQATVIKLHEFEANHAMTANLDFAVWSLEFVWILGFGIWNLFFTLR